VAEQVGARPSGRAEAMATGVAGGEGMGPGSLDSAFFCNISDVDFLDTTKPSDLARAPRASQARVKWIGGTPAEGPWAYWIEHPAGSLVRPHKHFVARIEYILEGALEWFEGESALNWRQGEPTQAGVRHVAGTLSYAPAGFVYGYRILEPTRLLHIFAGDPVNKTEHIPVGLLASAVGPNAE
jgi:hypothetical protein